MRGDWQAWYSLLRNHDPDLYRKAIEYSEGVTLTHGLGHAIAADVESALVMLACDARGLSLPVKEIPE